MNVLPLILAAAAVVAAPDPRRPGPHESYELVTLADGVYGFIAPEGRTGTVQGNSVAVVGTEGVLVVDTGQFPDLTRRNVVFVPDAKVVVAGDMVVYPTPYAFGSWLSEWTATLRKLEALGATRIVPGHGPVLRDNEYVQLVMALIGETQRQVQALVKEGLSLEEVRKRVDLAGFRRSLAGDDYFRDRAFDEFYLRPAVGQAYKEAKGEPLDEASEG